MSEYLRALKPIVTAQQYEKTKNIVKQFSANPGPQLHQYLVEKQEAEDNWVSGIDNFIDALIYCILSSHADSFFLFLILNTKI